MMLLCVMFYILHALRVCDSAPMTFDSLIFVIRISLDKITPPSDSFQCDAFWYGKPFSVVCRTTVCFHMSPVVQYLTEVLKLGMNQFLNFPVQMMRLTLAVVNYFKIGYAALILDLFHPFVDVYCLPNFHPRYFFASFLEVFGSCKDVDMADFGYKH